MRTFDTGATRDTDQGKLDYEAFLSPRVLRIYAEFMHRNRIQKDGALRDGDNWQKGMPLDEYYKSLIRHVFSAWEAHREGQSFNMDEMCAVLFNANGIIYEQSR